MSVRSTALSALAWATSGEAEVLGWRSAPWQRLYFLPLAVHVSTVCVDTAMLTVPLVVVDTLHPRLLPSDAPLYYIARIPLLSFLHLLQLLVWQKNQCSGACPQKYRSGWG